MTMMAFIDNKVPRRDSHLFKLKSLSGNVSSTDHVNKIKDAPWRLQAVTKARRGHDHGSRSNSNEPGLGYSSTTDRMRNKHRSSNINNSF